MANEAEDKSGKKEEETPIKVILLGDSAVGKSKLVERFLMDGYQPQQLSTYALTLFGYEAKRDGKTVNVNFWDTAGQERFNKMHPSYYHEAHCCILVFDITRKVTYKNLEKWFEELMEFRPGIPCLVAANKIDIDLEVIKKTFNFATKRGLQLFYVSASEGTNVVKMFEEAITLGIHFRDNPPEDDLVAQALALLKESDLDDKEEG
jgi:Rab-like protein 2|eukprot:CAMPEP_0174294760 /NCGR_PEP_ID=MMETSP0809-20121228/42547_1 /TAXON_ID=73025 ORGANISM="Eutreptiella gymnastica-like, Strain CCMP1594" /NCGR_SAMPLE_ID=MMETSP0809 /ASSEMBLY_ACC=CAM_ASM_000658 /LENGTH=205 /DNA_ID=CAMNT_0015396449 /DNA_START=61 /DNA_END=678 /DNA_ORIENTATION=-